MNDPDLPDGSLPIGTISIHYYLGDDGHPYVQVDRPEFDVIPALSQLGMIAFTQDYILHGGPEDDDE